MRLPKLRLTGSTRTTELQAEIVFPDGEVREIAAYEINVEAKVDSILYATVKLEVESINVTDWEAEESPQTQEPA